MSTKRTRKQSSKRKRCFTPLEPLEARMLLSAVIQVHGNNVLVTNGGAPTTANYTDFRDMPTTITGRGLDVNLHDDGLEVATTHSGSGTAIVDGSAVTVSYVGYLLNGFQFDASTAPFAVVDGRPRPGTQQDGVIPGWNEGLIGMQ